MKTYTKGVRITNTVICVLVVLFLAFSFVYPGRYLKKLTGELSANARNCITAALSGDNSEVLRLTSDMLVCLESGRETLKLFINHEDIDQLDLTVKSCVRLAQVHETPQLLSELEHVINIAHYLSDIETFSVYNLF